MNDSQKGIVLKFKVSSFRRIPNPYSLSKNEGQKKPEIYEIIADVKDLPDNIPMGTNPRDQKLTTNVAKRIQESLLNHSDLNFYLLNRGILLSAESAAFDSATNIVTISFTDLEVHGNVDGGHTYRIIKENRNLLEHGEQYVKIEVLTGIEDMFEDLAAARNTSVQVTDKSMDELRGMFDVIIKDALQYEPYASEISYKENDTKRIDVLDLIAVMTMFNIERYPTQFNGTYPIVSYSSKQTCLKYYQDSFKKNEATPEQNPYVKMKPILVDIFRIYDTLQCKIGEYYRNGIAGKKYGSVTGVATHKPNTPDFKSKFYQHKVDYESPKGFLYPIIGAFRALVEEYNGVYRWKIDPLKALDELGPTLVNSTVDMSRALKNNPNAVGKSNPLWTNLFMAAQIATMSSK